MSRVIRRAGRKGFYLQIPVPRDLRLIFKTSSIIRKLGNSEVDAQENKELLERQIKNEFFNARKENNLLSTAKESSFKDPSKLLLRNFKHCFFEKQKSFNEKALVLSFWHCIGHSIDLKKNNSYQIIKFFNLEVIVHNEKGTLWAFENRCPHRGSKFFKDSCSISRVTCPYHGWTFTNSSTFITRKDTFEKLNNPQKIRPTPWKVKLIAGFIFIAFKPFFKIEEQLGEKVLENLYKIGYSLKNNFSTQFIEFKSDWKIAIENSLEPYHVSIIHKDSLAALGFDDGDNELFNWASILNHNISSKRVKQSINHIKKMLYLPIEFQGYWSLYLFPFAMISTTGGTTYAHQFYQPLEETEQTECITKLWCLETSKEQYEETLNNFYKSVSETNLQIFQEDAEICSYSNKGIWNEKPLLFKSNLEAKVDHFRKCIRNFESIISSKY